MSESFLTRWSRRKREAEQAAPEAKPEGESTEAAPPAADGAELPEVAVAEKTVDLDSLPPIESITAATDIRAFLAPGVPAQLARAALRRVWTADPAIRDFVGLAENAWDFNDPASVPGFGPAVTPHEVQRILASMTDDQSAPQPASGPPTPDSLESHGVYTPPDEQAGEDAPVKTASD